MRTLALKIDVDTWHGTREGVPRLVALLKKYQANATFLFSLGPDHTGRAIKRVFRKGFLQKVSRTSVVEHYGVRTLLYGTLLPGPDIGKREASLLRWVRDQGFEVGIHTWDHIKWQDYVTQQSPEWTQCEMQKAATRFQTIFGEPARTHGAAGWQINPSALAYERTLDMLYASDCRGTHPFLPIYPNGEVIGPPQLPTTLPTLDELIGLNGLSADNVHTHLLALTAAPTEHGHVYTLHAELEGRRMVPVFERLLEGWGQQGYELCSTITLFQQTSTFPEHQIVLGTVPGRSGKVAVQAPCSLHKSGIYP